MTGTQRSGRGRSNRVLWLLGASIVAVLALWIADALHKAAPGRLGIPQPSGSGADLYFRKLGPPPDAGPPTDFRHVDQDGMVSDYASGTYRVLHTREDVFGYYRATCRRVGLTSPASSETLIYYPERRGDRDRYAAVHRLEVHRFRRGDPLMTDRSGSPPAAGGLRRVSYTCRYGLVDWGHALPGRPNDPNSLAELHRQLTMGPALSSHPQRDPRAQWWGNLPFGHASMQDQLVALGYLEARQADGLIGRSNSATLDAIEAFQRRNGLKTDRDLGGPNSRTRHRLAMPVAKLVRAI